MENSKSRLFVDMDGTLARFHDEVQYLERMFEKGFFRDLKPFENAVNAINKIVELQPEIEVFILSATVDGIPPHCEMEKHAWLMQYLPRIDNDHKIFTKMGEKKADFIPNGINETDVLFDDYNKNLEEWQDAGGFSVKAKNNINHKGLVGKLWQGNVIDITDNSQTITMQLSSCIKHASIIEYENEAIIDVDEDILETPEMGMSML